MVWEATFFEHPFHNCLSGMIRASVWNLKNGRRLEHYKIQPGHNLFVTKDACPKPENNGQMAEKGAIASKAVLSLLLVKTV